MHSGGLSGREGVLDKRLRAAMMKMHAPDALLDAHECASLVGGMSPENWPRYASRFRGLVEGARIVRVTPGSRGRTRWRLRAVLEHIETAILQDDAQPKGRESAS